MFSTFGLHFPWIGLGAGAVLAVFLLATNALRQDLTVSRWRDPAWLGWLAVAIYLFHNFEEYGISAVGVKNAFPDSLCATLGLEPYPACPIPPVFYIYVNIGMVWVVAVICAVLARRYVIFGFAFYSVVFVNIFFHVGGAIATGSYNPGLLTALILFVPASTWAAFVFLKHRNPALGVWRLLAIVALGIVTNGSLPLTIKLFLNGALSAPILNALQIVNAGLIALVGALLQVSLRRLQRSYALGTFSADSVP